MQNLEHELRSVTKKRLLVIYPHPDDEVYNAAGLIMRAKALGFEVMIVSLTKGGKGKHYSKVGDTPLTEVRSQELMAASRLLGADGMKILDYPDGGLKDDLSWVKDVDKLLVNFDPGVVVTYDHSGLTGHPDHIVLSVELLGILKSKSSGVLLLWSVWPGLARKFMVHTEVSDIMCDPDVVLNLSKGERRVKWEALLAHRSQLGNLRWWQLMLLKYFAFKREYFCVANLDKSYDYKYVNFEI